MDDGFGIDFKTEDVSYIGINIGDLRSRSRRIIEDGSVNGRCSGEFELRPMTEQNIKQLFESLSYGEIIRDWQFYDAGQFRAWLYGDRKSAPKAVNFKMREKYTIPACEKRDGVIYQ